MNIKAIASNQLQSGIHSPLTEAKRLLRQGGLHAKKGLGQHFLIDEVALQRIVSAAELNTGDTVVEVGPGLGILTRELARQAGQVIAIELDARIVSLLKQTLIPFSNVNIINADILRVDLAGLLGKQENSYKVIANLPYYITSPILRHFLETSSRPCLMIVMVQKEVGEVIVAGPGKMSLLSISVQFYGKPAIVGHVPARSFYPPPKVDSVILRIDPYSQPVVSVADEASFFETVQAGFTAPRKQLHNSLAQGLGMPTKEVAPLLENAGIHPQRRAETLSLEEWERVRAAFAQAKTSECSC
ncbi:16S rRNA (adenine(1518)-N(6)/adenine(1519)-N(6))-dimethyltransferase RsmA [Chloroflexota bacterium]